MSSNPTVRIGEVGVSQVLRDGMKVPGKSAFVQKTIRALLHTVPGKCMIHAARYEGVDDTNV